MQSAGNIVQLSLYTHMAESGVPSENSISSYPDKLSVFP